MRRLLSVLLLLLLPAGGCGQRPEDQTLRRMIDEALPGIAAISGLEPLEPVRVERPTRAEMREFIEEQLREELPPEELEGLTAVYKALGLLPPELDLRALLLELYTEQIVGYYDPGTETLYVVEGVSPASVGPVLNHELVHALQDQHVDLDSLISRHQGNDRQLAAQAAVEGQATLVMMAALLSSASGGDLIDVRQMPELGEDLLRPALEAENSQFPVFQSAPRILRETLLFPYLHGAIFVQTLWRNSGVSLEAEPEALPQPFGPNLPLSTEQVLYPQARFLDERDDPTDLELEPPGDWRTLYEDGLGELELSVFLSEHLGIEAAALARGWDGDRYRVLESPAGERAFVLYSVWDDEDAADLFADRYRAALAARPGRHGQVERFEREGRPLVRVVEAGTDILLDRVPVPELTGLAPLAR